MMFVATGIPGLDDLISGFPEGEIVIVAGRPGTGKTVFSASFLYNGAVKFGEKGVYVSLVEDKEAFLRNMRSLGFDFEELEKRGLFEFLELLTVREEVSKSLLAEIMTYIEESKPKRLVIDSFSAMVYRFKDPREVRVFLHALFTKIIKRLKCTTILVEEIPYGDQRIGYGFEEFIASAIILLKSRIIDGRIYRELLISKLRGARIRNPLTCFTIREGLRVFTPWKVRGELFTKPYQPISEPPQGYSTGIPVLDDALGGGLRKGSTVLIELDPEVSYEQYHLLLDPIVLNYVLAADRPCVIVPSAGVGWEDVLKTFKLFGVPDEKLRKLIRVIEPVKEIGEVKNECVLKWTPTSPEKDFEELAKLESSLMESTGHPPLRFIGIDRVAHYHGQEGLVTLANLDVTRTKKLGSLTIWLFKSVYPEILKRLVPLSTIYLKLVERNGCLLLYGVKPRTPFYAIEQDLSKGYPLPKLTLIE